MSEIKISLAAEQTIGVKLQPGGSGSAETAKRLKTPRTIAIGGEAIGETMFDGSEDVTIYTAIERLTNEDLEEMLQ